jgi:hemolysin activation/secretion protein
MVLDEPDFGGRTDIVTANFGAQIPFKVGGQLFSYQFDWHTQSARTSLTPSDYFTIGTRASVRGFNQQMTLAAESGWAVSHELNWYLPTSSGTQSLYGGVDVGRVRGHAINYLTGQTLAGAVVGARGQLAPKTALRASLIYDISVGWPLSKPPGFSGSPTFLFQISSLF